jgi:predicted MFS family arabinose efflux permease
VLSTGGTLLDGFVIFVLGVAMPLIIAEFHFTPDVVGLIGASLVFGAVFGAGFGGPMADHLGRRKLMLADMIIIAAGAATSALANGFPMLLIGQLLVGIGVGIDFPAGSSYVSEVLPKRSRARMMVATVPWFLMDIATYGVGVFTPIILGAINVCSKSADVIAHDFADAKGSAAIDLFLLLGFLVGIWAVPRFGRIRMQGIGFASMAFGMLLLVIAVRLSHSSLHIPFVFAGFILFNLLMNAGPNSTTFTLAPILFPIELRATASGFAAGVAKIGATLGVFVLPILKGTFGVPAVLGMMAVVSVLGLVVTLAFGHEDTED